MPAVLTSTYDSPLGPLLLACDAAGLTGVWFEAQRHFARTLPPTAHPGTHPHLEAARLWLEAYFAREPLPPLPPLNPQGTAFQQQVWKALLGIPYGGTATYGQLADRLARAGHMRSPSPRAVGAAVGRNPISLLIPCHRVLGAGGSLTGYAGGLERKRLLLQQEGTAGPRL